MNPQNWLVPVSLVEFTIDHQRPRIGWRSVQIAFLFIRSKEKDLHVFTDQEWATLRFTVDYKLENLFLHAHFCWSSRKTPVHSKRGYQGKDRALGEVRWFLILCRFCGMLRSPDNIDVDQILAPNSAIKPNQIASNLSVKICKLESSLKNEGNNCYVALIKANLEPANCQARRDFVLQYINENVNFWKRVVFTDDYRPITSDIFRISNENGIILIRNWSAFSPNLNKAESSKRKK